MELKTLSEEVLKRLSGLTNEEIEKAKEYGEHYDKEKSLSEYIDESSTFFCKVVPVDNLKKTIKEILEEIDNAQEDCGNLDWINKEHAIKIIKQKVGPKLI